MDDLSSVVQKTGEALLAQGLTLATAESCTGGWIAQQATALSGSSEWFECGFVSYSNQAKQFMLGVKPETLTAHGAVSEEVVCEMVGGAIQRSNAGVAVAVSGVAGPTGGCKDKPVGTVWVAWGKEGEDVKSQRFLFPGDRQQVRWQTVEAAFAGLLQLLTT